MDRFRREGERLLSGKKGEALRALAATDAAQKLGESAEAKALGEAAQNGDAAALQKALTALLNTPEGRAVAENLGRLGHG